MNRDINIILKRMVFLFYKKKVTFFLIKYATIAIAFEICSFYSQTQIGKNKVDQGRFVRAKISSGKGGVVK